MGRIVRQYLFSLVLMVGCLGFVALGTSIAADWSWVHKGMAEEGLFGAGFRVGPSFTTQSSGVSTVGPALNFLATYGINKWFRAGAMVEWENHGMDAQSGSLNTISILPATLEYYPGQFGPFVPYLTTGIGVNINTKDVEDSFAWRVGGGINYALTNWFPNAPEGLALNMETAWKRNHHASDGSTMGLLFGIRDVF